MSFCIRACRAWCCTWQRGVQLRKDDGPERCSDAPRGELASVGALVL